MGKQVAIPQAAKTGIWAHILNVFLPIREFTEKEVKVERGSGRGRKQISYEIETLDAPIFVLVDPRNEDATANDSGIRGLRGRITDANGKHTPEVLGDTFLVIDGQKVPFTLTPGMTGTEGAKTKSGRLKKRNPKFDTGTEGVAVSVNGNEYTFRLGISQTGDNSLFMWGSVKPYKAAASRTVDESSLVDLSELASFVDA
jgi:hypothetical protein